MKWIAPAIGGTVSAAIGAAFGAFLELPTLGPQAMALGTLLGAIAGSSIGWCLFAALHRARATASRHPLGGVR